MEGSSLVGHAVPDKDDVQEVSAVRETARDSPSTPLNDTATYVCKSQVTQSGKCTYLNWPVGLVVGDPDC